MEEQRAESRLTSEQSPLLDGCLISDFTRRVFFTART
uniref:Uncharacterized protein n=1 Tax=Anguilla anguilla TaxID=7936 RepID=A0A0E9XJE8_ANGAN